MKCVLKESGKLRCWQDYKDHAEISLPTGMDYVVGYPKKFSKSDIPVINGTASIGKKLSAVVSNWDAGVTFQYQWLRSGKPIKGATLITYTVSKLDKGCKLSVQVTGNKAGYLPLSKFSKQIAAK